LSKTNLSSECDVVETNVARAGKPVAGSEPEALFGRAAQSFFGSWTADFVSIPGVLEPRDLPLLAVLVAVAQAGSFTGGAKSLGISKSLASENVRALEERCGARLLERSTRSLRLTQVGEAVVQAATAVIDAARQVDVVLEEHRATPVGTLRVTSTQDLGECLVSPVAARLAARHPELRVDVVAADTLQDVITGQFDVAIRLGNPKDSSLAMRRLATFDEPIVAAPALAEAFPRVTRPSQLAGAPWVRHSLISRTATFRFLGPRGETQEVPVSVRAQANTGNGVRALLLGGAGFGMVPEYLIAGDLARGALRRVCPDWVWKRVTLFAILPSAKRHPKRVELFLAALKDALAEGILGSRTAALGP
jgi:DNA-binding transcriptional LysR family regulator